jgi:ribonucleoside-diphosphate reductase subunit M1
MYYLRTMAASAPIQFTVDQAALQQVDTAVANKVIKKRPARPVPAPMMESKASRNSIATPSSEEVTSSGEDSDAHVEKLAVVANPSPTPSPKKTNGTKLSPKKTNGVKREEMNEVEQSIYDEAVIACSIEVCRHPQLLMLESRGL